MQYYEILKLRDISLKVSNIDDLLESLKLVSSLLKKMKKAGIEFDFSKNYSYQDKIVLKTKDPKLAKKFKFEHTQDELDENEIMISEEN